MLLRADVRGAVASDHAKIVAERRTAVERDLSRWKALRDGFTVAEQILQQRKTQAMQADPPLSGAVLDGYQSAIEEFGRFREQTRDAIAKNEGAMAVLGNLEETFKKIHVDAVSRVRGMEVQGARAVSVAESQERAGQMGEIPEVRAKAPIAASEQETPSSRRSRRKPEPR